MGSKPIYLLGHFAPEAPLRSALSFRFLALGRQENPPVGGASRVFHHDFTGTSGHGSDCLKRVQSEKKAKPMKEKLMTARISGFIGRILALSLALPLIIYSVAARDA